MQCLEKDPAKRPRDAQELARMFRAAAGLSVEQFQPRRASRLAVGSAVLAVGLLGTLAVAVWPRRDVTTTKSPRTEPPVEPLIAIPPKPVKVWEPEGYKAVDPSQLAENSNQPLQLEKEGVIFDRIRPGIYLPGGHGGYAPESENWPAEEGEWPPVIVRGFDHARFIHIPAGTYLRGDPRPSPDRDFRRNLITAHWVKVKGFYIQETEVTNEEIEKYLDTHPEDAKLFEAWRRRYNDRQKDTRPVETAHDFPAECISFQAARKFAREMRGRLPTEAEWEFAAKSCHGDRLYPWGVDPPLALGQRPRANIFDPRGDIPVMSTAVVKTFPKDKTDQLVFDMVGNVSEWCLDAYKPYAEIIPRDNSKIHPWDDPSTKIDPADPAQYCVIRGGSVRSSESKSRAFYRGAVREDEPGPEFVGFRIVVECPPEPEPAN